METSVKAPSEAVGPRGVGALPTAVVVGSQKCGTSTLHYYLSHHPQVSASDPKELNFFIAERNWELGLDWYRSHFDPALPVRLESSPNYTTYPHHRGIPERMHEVVPDARLIFMVRDPIARIEAHWVHNYAKRRERGTMLETIMHPSTTYVLRSRYYMQLERFLEHYDPARILVLDQDDLRQRRLETLRRVFEFLGADPGFEHRRFRVVRHRTEKKRRQTRAGARIQELSRSRLGRRIPKAVWLYAEAGLRLSRPIERPRLKEELPPEVLRLLRDDALRLRELTGRSFEGWSVWDAPA